MRKGVVSSSNGKAQFEAVWERSAHGNILIYETGSNKRIEKIVS
jgi:hypothetical protein